MPEVKMLTAAAIEKYKPTKTVREIKDAATMGLYLTIHPTGTKVWCMKLMRPGGASGQKLGHLTLGRVDLSGAELEGEPVIGQPLSLAAARLLAARIHRDRKLGKDVIGEHKAAKLRQRLQAQTDQANTFGSAARQFIERYAKKEQRRWRDTAAVLGFDYPPDEAEPVLRKDGLAMQWAAKPLKEIDRALIRITIEEAGANGIPGSAKRTKGHSDARERAVLSALSGVFSWLLSKGKIEANPCAGIEVKLWNERERFLSNDEIRWFWQASVAEGQPFGNIFRLLLLTGQRLNEIAAMQRAELFDNALNLPGSRTKNHRPHIVPLCQAALDLIPAVETDYVFTTTGVSPVSGWSTVKTRLDAAMLKIARKEKGNAFTIPHWQLHDLRRTAITGMNELRIEPWVVEQVVNHVSGPAKKGVAGVYNKARLLPERKIALQRWSDHVHGLVSGTQANVIPLRRVES
jgi:integrase